jgi:enoyl-[acyl-carrier protein] reductase I
MTSTLDGKKGLVIGVANDHSIAWGCAEAFHGAGAELAITYLNAKAEPYVRPLAEKIASPIILPLDVRKDSEIDALFEAIAARWGTLDFLLHAIAYAPAADLHAPISEASRAGFLEAMEISCYSFINVAHRAALLMKDGGSLLTVSYYGAEKVVPNYNLMGPVKAALESSVRYLAADLGPKGIRVNALSPGPVMTRAAGGIADFDTLLEEARRMSPEHAATSIDGVGAYARFLVSDEARLVTGSTLYIDAGFNIMGA